MNNPLTFYVLRELIKNETTFFEFYLVFFVGKHIKE